ncbi:MAG: hypothetical protein AAB914_01390 [Patescibacteria group bacterium]
MSEFYNGAPLEEGSTAGQRELLYDIQELMLSDEYSPLIDKVNELLLEDERLEKFFGDRDFIKPVVAVTKLDSVTGEGPVIVYNLRFARTDMTRVGMPDAHCDIPVAEFFGGGPLFVYDRFSGEEATLVAQQVDLIKTAQDEGLLPNLNPSMTKIHDYSAALMKLKD